MTDFKRRFMTDKLLEIIEYAAVQTTIEGCMGGYVTRGYVKVDEPYTRILHLDTKFKVYSFEKRDIQAITYDVSSNYATIQLSIGR